MDKKEAAIKTLECMLDTTSNMDKKVVEKEFKVRTIKTDTGFVIKNKFNAFKDNSKYKIINNQDGTTDLLIKNIQYFKEG